MKEEDLLHLMTEMTKYFASNFEAVQQRVQIAQKTFGEGYWGEAFLSFSYFPCFSIPNDELMDNFLTIFN